MPSVVALRGYPVGSAADRIAHATLGPHLRFRAPLPRRAAVLAATPPAPAAAILPNAPPCATCRAGRSLTAALSQIDPAAPAYRRPSASAPGTHHPRCSSG